MYTILIILARFLHLLSWYFSNTVAQQNSRLFVESIVIIFLSISKWQHQDKSWGNSIAEWTANENSSNQRIYIIELRICGFEVSFQSNVSEISDLLTRFPLFFVSREEYQGLLTYYVPATTTLKWSTIFGVMEKGKKTLQIEDYSISQTSLEQVFLSFTKFQREEIRRPSAKS